ncbi:MAG: hypothetical protein F4Z31_00035 [Gemmatimonadetes bacterium]|nr:hypothetical protein [Gemmatimonadota bacterium]MYA40175.1 hypothetical protein [Gemmatimonadota bacterium]MYE94367.1 hypothetical protein [Gemmatimonadota bacterium]MYJ11244.1 hypothetical protein [Gemmatimonadota bacterium]
MEAPTELSKESPKTGKPSWWRLVYAGWALFAVSFLLPAYVENGHLAATLPEPRDTDALSTEIGAGAFLNALLYGDGIGQLSALTNLFMLASLLILPTSRREHGRRLRWLVGGAGVLNLVYWPIWMVGEGDPVSYLLIGYWSWVASFFCVAAGLWMIVNSSLHHVIQS